MYRSRLLSIAVPIAITVAAAAPAHAAGENPPAAPRTTLLTGDVSTRTGAFTHTLPLGLPPARRGTAPSLALVYDSTAPNGLAGHGWRVSGIPAIVRVPGDRGLRFDGQDTYAYAAAGWSGALPGPDDWLVAKGNQRYHRAREDAGPALGEFAWDGTTSSCADQQIAGSSPCAWILRERGFTYKFGTVANARLWEPNNGVTNSRGITVWSLYQVIDPDGNYWQVTYTNTGATLYPAQVEYNLPRAGATPRSLRVDFEYTARTDVTPAPFRFPVVLSRIRVNGHCTGTGCSLVRMYQLAHTPSGASGRRLLTSFQELGGDLTTSLPAQTFAYTSGGGAPAAVADSTTQFTDVAQCDARRDRGADCAWQTHVGDIDGDGKDDVVRFFAGETGAGGATRTFLAQYTCGRADGLTGPTFALPTVNLATFADSQGTRPPIEGWRSVLTDVNGDGKKDLVVVNPTAPPTMPEQQVLISGIHLWSVALGGARGPCSLGDLPVPSREQVRDELWANGAGAVTAWSFMPTDGDGRGQGGVVMIDHVMRRVHEKASAGTDLGQTHVSPYSHPQCRLVQWQSGDVDGDGRQDLDAFSYEGSEMCFMTSSAGGTGTGANYSAFTTTSASIVPSTALPFVAVRPGDLNGDGRTDFVFNYQGPPVNGVGRDLRYWLGAAGTAPNPIRAWMRDGATYPGSDLLAGHLNEWEYLVGDVTGDGLDDYVQVYLGAGGVRIAQAISTPTGPGTLATHTSAPGAMPDNANGYAFHKWHAALADLNGDGLQDLAYAQYGNAIGAGPSVVVGYYLGTPTGLSTTLRFLTSSANDTGGDSRNISMRVADLNGDGKDDLLFVNDNVADPRTTIARIAYAVSRRNAPFVATVQDTPDLLRRIDNGLRATTSVEYRLAGDFASAIAPDAQACSGAGEAPLAGHRATGPACGNAAATPRPLVARVVRDDGRGFVTSVAYDYDNGRVRPGRRSQRAELGFASVRRTDEQTTGYEVEVFRQEPPFHGHLRERHVHGGDAAHGRMSKAYLRYAAVTPVPGVTVVQRVAEEHAVYNRAGAAASFTAARTYAYDPTYGMIVRATELDDQAAYEGTTEYGYRAADPATWTVGRLDSVRVKGSDPAAPTGFRVLAMERVLYDEAGGRRWRPIRVDQLQFDRFDQASCATYGDPWAPATCQAEIAAKLAHWVTVAQNFVHDAYGNVTSVDGVRTQLASGAWNDRRVRVDYDGAYLALPARETNALGHVASRTFDLAGRVLTATDANNQTTTTTYDALGRVKTVVRPGQTGVGKVFDYLQLGDAANQRTEVRTSTGAGTSAVTAFYLDGHGEPWKVLERSPLGDVQRLRSRAFVGGLLRERTSEPHSIGASPQYLERRTDFAGRPSALVRTDASFTTSRPIAAFAYQDDGSIVVTDAGGFTNRVYKNARGLVTRVTDAIGNDTRYAYNAAWKRSRVTLPGGAAIELAWDGRFRPYALHDPNASGYTRYVVDDAGNVTLVVHLPTPTSPPSAATRMIRYTHDALDRPAAEIEVTPATGAETTRVTFGWDETFATNGKGRMTSVIDPSGLQAFDYDARGNVSRRIHALTGLPGSYAYGYAYNDRDQVTSKVFPSGGPWSATDQGTETYLYTADGVLTDIQRNGTPWAKWSGWNAHRKPAMAYRHWNGFEWAHMTEYGYDPDQRLAEMTTWTADGQIVADNLYTYDAVGHLATIDDRRTATLQGSIETDATQLFQYDPLGRLTRVSDNLGPAQTFSYDALGTQTADTGTVTTRVACGAQTCLENRTGATLNWRTYQDSEGKRTRFDDVSVNASYFYHYDYQGRLASVVKDGITKESFRYDFAGRRTHETFVHPGNAYATTTWSVGDAYAVRSASDQPSRYARTVDIGGVAHWTTGDLIRGQLTEAGALAQRGASYTGAAYYGPAQGTFLDVPDHKGTPALTTHPDGALVTRHWLDVWGAPRPGHGTGPASATVGRYNGFATSDYSKLLYAGSRYYHPKTRTFITPDDRVVAGGAQGFHRYAYAANDPASHREDGHQGQPIAGATPGAVGAEAGAVETAPVTAAVIAEAASAPGFDLHALGTAVLSTDNGMSWAEVGWRSGMAVLFFRTLANTAASPLAVVLSEKLLLKMALVAGEHGLTIAAGGRTASVVLAGGTVASLVGVVMLNVHMAMLTYEALAQTPVESLRQMEKRHGPIAVDPNIVLTPDGGWRWKTRADTEREERLNAARNGGYPVEPGADTETGGDFGGGSGGGGDTGWFGDGDGGGTPYEAERTYENYEWESESSNGSTLLVPPW